MDDFAYPVRRELRRLRRWLDSGGAAYRLLAPVCASPAIRTEAERALVGGGAIRFVPVDLTKDDLIPDSYRQYRGSHATYTLFRFAGLAARVARDGVAPLLELDAAEALFKRPATWALFWIEDPHLQPLIERHAPRFAAAIELAPTLTDPALISGSAPPSPLRPLVDAIAAAGRGSALDPTFAVQLALERGDPLAAQQLLRARSLPADAWLLLAADAHLLAAEPQRALARLAAAASGPRRAESLAAIAAILARQGDRDGAAACARESLAGDAPPTAAVRAHLVTARLGLVPLDDALSAARAAAADHTSVLLALARSAGELDGAVAPTTIADILDQAIESAGGDPTLAAAARAQLGLLLASQPDRSRQARALLEPLSGVADPAAALAAGRGLARLELDARKPDAAEVRVMDLRQRAVAAGLVEEAIQCLWLEVAAGSAREDLAGVLGSLDELRQYARAAGRREVEFAALERHARALRFARELALAAGELDALAGLAQDLTWPDLELRAAEARADHLLDVGATGEARKALERGAEIAEELGLGGRAAELRARAG